MNRDDIVATFDKYKDEFGRWDRIQKQLASRPQVHALIVLDRICPVDSYIGMIHARGCGILGSGRLDETHIRSGWESSSGLTEEVIIELIRCGLQFSHRFFDLELFWTE